MKIFVINLDEAVERRTHMERMFAELGLAFERLRAVNGRAFNAQTEEDRELLSEAIKNGLTPGVAGCYVSHFHALQLAAESKEPFTAVFEDDVHLSPEIGNLLLSAAEFIPSDADIIKLETNATKAPVSLRFIRNKYGRRLHRLFDTYPRTGAYIVSKKGVVHILEHIRPISCPVDHLMFDPAYQLFKKLIVYQMVPAPCIQNELLPENQQIKSLGSWIAPERPRKPKKTFFKKMFRELTRPFKKLSKAILDISKGRALISVPFE